MLALAPDPIHTNLGLFFDRKIVSIQQAAQDEGYDFDSAWLPWRRNTTQNLNNLADRERAVDFDLRRESCPGVLLFRSHDHSSGFAYTNALVVFVIGEQPTGGINLKEWDNALLVIKMLRAGVAPDVSFKIQLDAFLRILGPTFSGSFDSLARKVDEIAANTTKKPSFSRILMLSGSTTNFREITDFRTHLYSLQPTANPWGLQFSFGTFNENDELHIARFLEYLKSRTGHAREVAILSEDETAYARDPGAYSNAGAKSSSQSTSQQDAPLDLKYPRDISVIRDAYQKQSVFDSALPKDHAVRTILRSESSSANGEGLDSLPGYSDDISALDQEARLFALLDHLRVHHIRYVILRSTNPLDLIFLARFFHRAYPEGRIVTIGSDLLFRREIDTNDFRGMMALSSYPLLPRAEDWRQLRSNGEEHTHQVFTGNTSEGDYMATRYLLQAVPLFCNAPAASPSGMAGICFQATGGEHPPPIYGNPYWLYPDGQFPGIMQLKNGQAPPTWLTTLGRDGYWPVAVLNSDLTDHPSSIVHVGLPAGISPSRKLDVPLAANICIVLAFVLAGYQLWGVSDVKLFTSDDLFFVFTNNPLIPTQPFLRGINSALALMPIVELTVPRMVLLRSHMFIRDRVTAVLISILILLTLYFLWKPRSRTPEDIRLIDLSGDRKHARQKASWMYLSCVMLMVTCYVAPFVSSNRLTERFPLVYRMEHITDGVSPLLPILLLTLSFYLWTWQMMAGNLMVGQGCPVLPSSLRSKDPEGSSAEVIEPVIGENIVAANAEEANQDPTMQSSGASRAWPAIDLCLRIVRDTRLWKFVTTARYSKFLGLPDPGVDKKEPWRLIPLEQFRLGQGMGRTILKLANPFHVKSIGIVTITMSTAFIFYLCFSSLSQTMSIEGIWYNRTLAWLVLFASGITIVEAFHLFSTWVQLRRLLLALGRSRVTETIARLKPISATSLWTVSTNVHRVQYRLFFQQHEALKRLVKLDAVSGTGNCLKTAMDRGQYIVEASRSSLRHGVARLWWTPFKTKPGDVPLEEQNIRATFADVAAYIMTQLLWEEWEKTPHSLYMKEGSAEDKILPKTEPQLKIAAAEEFISAHYVAFIHNIIARMRTMTMAMALIFATICFALSSYTFSPRPYISAVLLVNFVIIGSTVAYVYAGMDRNEILSSIADTTPGRLGAEFWVKLIGFLIGPVIGILATQYPSIFDAFIGWIQPGINAVK